MELQIRGVQASPPIRFCGILGTFDKSVKHGTVNVRICIEHSLFGWTKLKQKWCSLQKCKLLVIIWWWCSFLYTLLLPIRVYRHKSVDKTGNIGLLANTESSDKLAVTLRGHVSRGTDGFPDSVTNKWSSLNSVKRSLSSSSLVSGHLISCQQLLKKINKKKSSSVWHLMNESKTFSFFPPVVLTSHTLQLAWWCTAPCWANLFSRLWLIVAAVTASPNPVRITLAVHSVFNLQKQTLHR